MHMCRLGVFSLVLSAYSVWALKIPTFPGTHDPPAYNSSLRPLVIWHGLGDTYSSVGMVEFADLMREVHPGLYVHRIWLEEDADADQKAGFVSDVHLS